MLMGKNYIVNKGKLRIITYNEKTIEKRPYASVILVPPNALHKTTFFKVAYIVEGKTEIECYSKNSNIKKIVHANSNTMFIVPPDVVNNYIVDKSSNYCHKDIYASPALMKECCDMIDGSLYEKISSAEFPVFFNISTSTSNSISEMLVPITNENKSKTNDIIHKSLLTYLLGQYVLSKSYYKNYPMWLKRFLRNLNSESYMLMSIEEMVASVKLSHGYVCRKFKKYTGMTIKQYVNKKKLEFSVDMLMTDNNTLEDIVEKLNFSSTAHFINLFKEEYGITPGMYRKERINY